MKIEDINIDSIQVKSNIRLKGGFRENENISNLIKKEIKQKKNGINL